MKTLSKGMKERFQYILLCGLSGLLGCVAAAQAETVTDFVAPDGAFEIQRVIPANDDEDSKIFVVSKSNPGNRVFLDTRSSIAGDSWHLAPDGKWLLDQIRDVHEVGHMELYRQVAGLKFDKIKGFSDRAWASLSSKRKYSKGEEGIMDFVNWSPDSARLLISLRGPVHGDADDKPWFTDWSVYFNLQTQKFEYTAYLDGWDSQVFKLTSSDDYDQLTSLAPASAEPLVDTVSEDDWKKRQTEADRALNEVYHRVLAKLGPADAARIRSEEVAWIKKRDRVTDEFAKQGTPANPKLRRLQAVVDLTNARTADLESQLKGSESQ